MWFSKYLEDKLQLVKGIFVSLQSKNYRKYFIGQGISLIGTWMQQVAMSWLVYRLTGSVFLLGLIAFTSQIPTFILAPFAGVLTDRFNRHFIMTATQVLFMIQAVTLSILVFTGLIEVWHLIVLSLLFGFISAFDAPARQSLVIDLIDKPENLGNAIALNSALFNGARLIGPGIAGITIALVGEPICFLINATSYIAVIWALISIKIEHQHKNNTQTNFKSSFTEGLKYTFGTPSIRTLLILLGCLSLFSLAYIVLMPAYAKEILHGGSGLLGFLMSSMGAGALTGALYLAARKSTTGLNNIIKTSTFTLAIAVIIAAYSRSVVLSMIALYFTGLSMIASIASINTLIQSLTEEDKRGRVMSFYAMALMGMNPIGNLIAGTVASHIGITKSLLFSGIITVIIGFWFVKRQKKWFINEP